MMIMIKAAVVKKHDIKTARLTKNISHKGSDSAAIVKFDLERLGMLVGTTWQEMAAMVDFFMTDR